MTHHKLANETPREIIQRQSWHLLAQQMTHVINCDMPHHKGNESCEEFTDIAHRELMAHIDTYIDAAIKEHEEKRHDK